MIRIELRPAKKRRWRPVMRLVALVVAIGALAMVGVAVHERLPGLGKGQVATPASVAPTSAKVDADSIPLVFAPVEQDTAGVDTAKARPVATSPVVAPSVPARPVSSPASAPGVVPSARVAATRAVPAPAAAGMVLARASEAAVRRSTPCSRTLDLCARLPAGVRLTALACDAKGAYTLEGTGASPRQIEAFLDTLREAGSQATLSWWSDGSTGVDGERACRFAFRGQHRAAVPVEPPALSPAQAAAAFSRVAVLARLAGLTGVSADSVVETPAVSGGRQRQQLSATGSPEQVAAFLNRLRQAPIPTVLSEVVVASAIAAGQPTAPARLTAAVEAAVLRP